MERDEAERFSDTLRRARHARGLSIRKAAFTGGISEATWRRLENVDRLPNYNVRPATLRAVAEAVRVSVDQVYHWAGETFHGMDDPLSLEAALVEGDERNEVPSALLGAWAKLNDRGRQRLVGYAQALADDAESVDEGSGGAP